MNTEEKCPICRQICETESKLFMNIINCPTCGKYVINDDAYSLIQDAKENEISNENRHIMSCRLWELNYHKRKIEKITDENYRYLYSDPSTPRTPIQKIDKLLINIYKNNKKIGQIHEANPYQIDYLDHRLSYAYDSQEIDGMINALVELGFIKKLGDTSILFKISSQGLKYAEDLLNRRYDTKQVFVAMKFCNIMFDVFEKAIRPAVQACGFEANTVASKEHNGKIDDEIIAGIRQSKFVIADFSDNNEGVYYEAGFAHGLGLQVIPTCKEDNFGKIHFDVNHSNFILWKDEEDLRRKLINRIKATII